MAQAGVHPQVQQQQHALLLQQQRVLLLLDLRVHPGLGHTYPSQIGRRPALFFLGHISPIFAPFFLVFSRFSPS